MSTSRIVQLAQLISSQTAALDEHIRNNGLAQPSFEPGAPVEPIQQATPDIDKAKTDVIEATIELRQLLEGPIKALLPECNFAPLASIHRFKIASFVPATSSISFSDLAEKCGLLEHDVRRIVRYAAVHHRVFCEPEKGYVAHTAASKVLVENERIGDVMGLTFEECWPAHARVPSALALKSSSPAATGYALANNTPLPTFAFLSTHPSRAQRFARAMSTTSPASLHALSTYFPWHTLAPGSTVVDIGGSQGHVSAYLAQQHPHLAFVVQDLDEVVAGAEARIPEPVRGRVRVEAHDMFDEQRVRADVYLLRFVLHDWSDEWCVRVLRALVGVLESGARVVVQDHLLPERGTVGLLAEMQVRSMDAIMLSLFNSREREEEDWRALFERASARFTAFTATRIKENPSTGVMVVEWS